MLVLTRKKNESAKLTVPASASPIEITVTIVQVRGSQVRVGFAAPDKVIIHRSEVAAAIERGERTRERGK